MHGKLPLCGKDMPQKNFPCVLIMCRISPESLVKQVHGFDFLAVDNLRVYLGGFHIGMTEQLAYRIEVSSEREQHRGEGVAACMK